MWIKFLGRMLGGTLMMAAVSISAHSALAQDSNNLPNYLGPGVASLGAGDVGLRSGEQVELRYYGGVSGIVDTNLQPFALDAQGNLLRIHNLYGVQVSGGAYGMHRWKCAQLGLDYGGDYHRYVNSDSNNGSDQHLTLGYTLDLTRRWTLNLNGSAGTIAYGTSGLANTPSSDPNSVFTPATLLFDSRNTFLQAGVSATYIQSARNSFTFGGSGFQQYQKAGGLSNSDGYTFTGSFQRRMSKATSLGASYSYSHYEFPAFHSNSDSNTYHGTYAAALGQFWTFSLEAGVTVSEVNSQITFALPPVLAALFGQSTVTENSYLRTLYPSGSASLKRRFRRASLGFNYSRGLNSGNGASGTGRLENATVALSYTGVRKLNIGVNGGYYHLSSLGQNTGSFSNYTGSAGFTYTLGHGISLSTRYDLNQQQIGLGNLNRTTTRATVGLMFSPGTLPLALW